MRTTCSASRYVERVDVDRRRPRSSRDRSSSGAARWIALAPIQGRAECGTHAVEDRRARGSCPGSRLRPSRRSARAGSRGHPRRARAPRRTAGAGRCARRRPLRRRRTRASRRNGRRRWREIVGEREQDREPALHVGRYRARAACRRRGGAAGCRSRAPCRDDRRARCDDRDPNSVRATMFAPMRSTRSCARCSRRARLDQVGERGFVAAHRRDRAELFGQRRADRASRNDAVLAQDRVELQLVVAGALGQIAQDRARTAGRTCRRRTPSCACPGSRPRSPG